MELNRKAIELVVCLAVCGSLASCSSGLSSLSPLSPLSYHVRPGDTLSEIGHRYGVPYQEIARLNNIRNPDRIAVGHRLRIPHGGRPSGGGLQSLRPSGGLKWPWQRTAPSRTVAVRRPDRQRAGIRSLPADRGGRFTWPSHGRLSSRFGPRKGRFHDGIDIAAPVNTPVLAAAAGEVIFSGTLGGYGKTVILRHSNGYTTVYAHHRVNLVKEGQFVRHGQRIAKVGQTGRTTGPHLHFEVRKNNRAQNPLHHLPSNRRTARAHRTR